MVGDRPKHFAREIFFGMERTFLRIYK